jgi:signal transduction histidine kinase
MDDAAAYPIQLCLNELLQNVFEWADSAIGCVVLTRWYHRSRSVRMAVIDRGVGIPARLRAKQIAGLHRGLDADVIEAAVTRPHLTSRVGRAGGLGLKTIHEVVTARGGRLTVMSHWARVTFRASGRTVARTRLPAWLKGTAIEVDFRPFDRVERPTEYVSVF